MLNIRPVSDLRNKYPEIEEAVLKSGEPVFLTKNGYGSMVVMSLEQYSALTDGIELAYSALTDGIELALDEADRAAVSSDVRYSADEVFGRVRKNIYGRKAL